MPLTRWERKEALGHGTCIRLAQAIGVHQSTLSLVLNGRRRSARIEAAIAEAIGLPVDMVFPARPTVAASLIRGTEAKTGTPV